MHRYVASNTIVFDFPNHVHNSNVYLTVFAVNNGETNIDI